MERADGELGSRNRKPGLREAKAFCIPLETIGGCLLYGSTYRLAQSSCGGLMCQALGPGGFCKAGIASSGGFSLYFLQ